jgi:hypothetical protein
MGGEEVGGGKWGGRPGGGAVQFKGKQINILSGKKNYFLGSTNYNLLSQIKVISIHNYIYIYIFFKFIFLLCVALQITGA